MSPLAPLAAATRPRPHWAGQVLRQLRVAHWVKNVTVLLPAFFAGKLLGLSGPQGQQLVLALGSFCLFSSGIYVLNDVLDVAHDRQHRTKRHRPYASGYFGRGQALALAGACLGLGLGCAAGLRGLAPAAPLAYVALNLLYCFWLKRLPIIDLSCIGLGFVLRLVAGGLVASAPLSHWIVIVTFLLMFSVGLAKRRDDLVLGSDEPGRVFRTAQAGYNKAFIDTAKGVSFAVTLVAYLLYTVSAEVMTRLHSRYVYVTALPVFLGIMRYLQLSIVQETTGSPVRLLLRDPFLLATVGAWLGIFYYLLYV